MNGYLLAGVVALGAALWFVGDYALDQRGARHRAEAALQTAKDNEKEVIRYVDRKVEVVKTEGLGRGKTATVSLKDTSLTDAEAQALEDARSAMELAGKSVSLKMTKA